MKKEIKERIDMINKGEVPEGYKKTKLGIIPEEWKVDSIKNIFEISGGKSFSRKNMGNEGVPCLHYGDIHNRKKLIIDDEEIKDFPRVDIDKSDFKDKVFLENGDLVFADASEDYADIGKSVLISNENNIPFIGGLHTIIAKDKNNTFSKIYKKYLFQIHNIKKEIKYYTSGTSVLGISRKNINKVSLFLPLGDEQAQIANILTTWDEAIELKEKLLEKKKDIKKGLRRLLITGEIRLKGHKSEWNKVRIKEVLNYEQPNKFLTNNFIDNKDDEFNIPVLTANKSFIKGYTSETEGIYTRVPIILFGDFTTNSKYVDFPFKIKSSALKILRTKKTNYNLKFIYELIQLIRFPVSTHKRYYISEYQHLKIRVPSINEQNEITDILSKADKSIELLEKEIELLREQKKGLMQLLLTGKVRVNEINEEILNEVN